jgi:hypothetical protein
LRNQDYPKVPTFSRDMYLAPHYTSSFTGGKEEEEEKNKPLFKIFPQL